MGLEPIGLSRRRALALCGGAVVLAGAALFARPEDSPPDAEVGATRYQYGDDPSQFGDLYLPSGHRRAGTMLILHGGFWRAEYGLELNASISADLARRGWAVWNLEYRRLGNGGGWPQTFEDVAAGTDYLQEMADRGIDLDLKHVVAIGHSAGGQLAAWLAARSTLAGDLPGADPGVDIGAVVSQAGILDLTLAAHSHLGGGAVVPQLLGGMPHERPDRYDATDPTRQVALDVPVRCVHNPLDPSVPYQQSVSYVEAATRAGGDALVVDVGGDHFALVNPTSKAWATTLQLLPELAGG